MVKFTGDLRCDFNKATEEITKLKDRILGYQEQISKLRNEVNRLQRKITADQTEHHNIIEEKDAIIKELQNRLAHAAALNAHDGTNTGMSTAKTPDGKKKLIPNSRRSDGKPKGGQPGHEKHSLEPPDESDITETVDHNPSEEGFCCPKCDSDSCSPTGKSDVKYEYDVLVKVVKRKHVYYYYTCDNCGTLYRSIIPPHLKEDVQYGSGVQALALSLTNTVNASLNKVSMFLAGITNRRLTPCEGYISKLQVRAAKMLSRFREELKARLITRTLIYWDDTVIMINTARACFRFYGDETIAYYTAHMHKDMESIDDDNVLGLLTSDTKAMHDHNTLNYNEKFSFQNIECNQHLQRDCQKNSDDTCHGWSLALKEYISTTIKDRNDAIERGDTSFDTAYIKVFHQKLDACLEDGWKQNKMDPDNYGSSFERTLLRRIDKYRKNYFLWVEDFSLPTTNNLSERGLRGVKARMKISGQFESEAAADHHALIRTYIETCRRNRINEITALQRLCSGNPYSVSEIFS